MGKNNNIIEINGKRYDARTGVVLSVQPNSTPVAKAQPSAVEPTVKAKSLHDIVRRPAKSAKAHKPSHSKTLMRHAVKKPSSQAKQPKLRAQGPSDIALRDSLPSIEVKKSAKNLDHSKLTKAGRVPKSSLIAHFGEITSDSNTSQPVLATNAVAPRAPKAIAPTTKAKTTSDLLEHAISQATSHEQKPIKAKKNRRPRMALASIAAIALIAFVGYQEVPKLQFNLAAAKAGFGASLPGYQPAGYGLGKLTYSPGVVATKFTSNSDQRNYTLTQKTSGWDSQALKENFVASTTDKYEISQTGGRTIYIYGKGNATWVNGGVWYIIQSNGALSDQQLIDVAKSI